MVLETITCQVCRALSALSARRQSFLELTLLGFMVKPKKGGKEMEDQMEKAWSIPGLKRWKFQWYLAFSTPEIKVCHLTQKYLRESNTSRCPKCLWRKNLEFEPTPADKMDPEALSAGNFCTQGTEHTSQSGYIPSSLLPYFWSTAMPCPFQENVQPQKSISAGIFNSKFTSRRREKKNRKPGLFKSIRFASWVQLLINHGGKKTERKSIITSLQCGVAPTLSIRVQCHCLVWHWVSWDSVPGWKMSASVLA